VKHMFFIYLILFGLLFCAEGRIIGAAVIPHGDFAYDPSLVNGEGGADELHRTATEVGQWVESLLPDLIFFSTPHGIAENNNFVLYGNTEGSGYAPIGADLLNDCSIDPPPPYNVPLSITLSPQIVTDIFTHLNGQLKLNISRLIAFGDAEPIPIRWGEVIPLSFLEHHDHNIIVLSMPTRRNQPVPLLPELIDLGHHLSDYLEQLSQRVAIVVSSDLAHTHLECGPYGYSPTAEPFDQACGRWARTLDPEPLLITAAGLVDEALSCGYTGLVLLHGILERVNVEWKPELLSNHHPTYYGMLVARFERPNQMSNATILT